jgi:Leucine-rich repeat (LRR) protein
MKQTYLYILLFVSFFSSAQIINFPDANFKTKVLAANPSNSIAKDLSNNYFKIDANNDGEIQITEAEQVKSLNVSFANILTLVGISNFTNLQQLSCSHNQIINLDVSACSGLVSIYCDFNQLNSLNITNCTSLSFLNCINNQLTSLNLSTCTSLNYLESSGNDLTSLNVTGLSALTLITCGSNELSTLDVSTCTALQILRCAYNQLTSIDISNCGSLYSLECEFNSPLTFINLKNNSPFNAFMGSSFEFNDCPNLQFICADDNKTQMIQQKITNYGYTNCNVNSYCNFTPGGTFYYIQGQQKFDNENDGCDTNDFLIPNFKYTITNWTSPGAIISNNTGSYSILVPAGTHTITPVIENPSYFSVSPPSATITFPAQNSPVTQNFCITPNGIHHDVEISIIPTSVARPGNDVIYKIIYKNKGNQIENGTINLQFDDAILDLVSTNPTFTTQTLNNLSWTYSSLQPFETRTIHFMMNVNSPTETPAVIGGDILNYTATNTITNTDEILSDNTFVLNQTVVNSYDPNDKTCLQGNYVGPDKIGDYVHYMIRFENTGTFPAENIVVKDMIDTAKFDVSSLVPLNASHNYFTRISGNKVEFIFENINLPFDDANNDGYIAFKIKTKPTLVLGNTFSNSANIYFDYNFPIVTNTATTTIAALNNPSFEFATYFSLYPNPTTNELNINLKSAIEINSIQIYNTIGQLVTVQTGNALKVDVSNLKTGNYFIKVNTNEGFSTSQFIKK